uniref:Dynein assembly factor 3, axonemal n=1 Tax=Strigamia maritima TaxID=126957 RepID=T1IVM6_STRMM
MEGHGFVTYWGFSPCLDLQEEIGVNVLLMGSGDIRHAFRTIAQAHRHPFRQLNLYIIEGSLDSLARNILFLKLICEPANAIGMQERTEMFLEIFGNLYIRPITARYIQRAAQKLILMITNLDYQADELPFLDLTHLKFKERDAMESIFKIWNKQKEIDFNTCWDVRLRRHLDLQYDSREGAFDWDYNIKLTDRGGGIIHTTEYKKWRRTGMAFELRDADYSVPNYSLVSPVVLNDSVICVLSIVIFFY